MANVGIQEEGSADKNVINNNVFLGTDFDDYIIIVGDDTIVGDNITS